MQYGEKKTNYKGCEKFLIIRLSGDMLTGMVLWARWRRELARDGVRAPGNSSFFPVFFPVFPEKTTPHITHTGTCTRFRDGMITMMSCESRCEGRVEPLTSRCPVCRSFQDLIARNAESKGLARQLFPD